MKFIKNNLKAIIGFVIGLILASSVTVYAYSYIASDVKYTNDKSVADALNDLYKKVNKTSTQVTTLTTQGATYTMQNDGYILGTATQGITRDTAILYLDEKRLILAPWDSSENFDVSVYVQKGTIVSTRSDGGTYNLTVYEWK